MICRDWPSGSNGWSWSAKTDSQIQMGYHDLQKQTLRYKWMNMICRHRPSGTNGWSWSAETEPQIHMEDHDMQRQTFRFKWMIMICKDRLSDTNGLSWSAEICMAKMRPVSFWPWNSTVHTDLEIYTGLFHPNSWQTPVAAVTVYSVPDDGRKERPKHVGHTCSCGPRLCAPSVVNKHNTARVASCWFIIYYRRNVCLNS